MWLLDSFKPSSNFAKWIKLMCEKMKIEISENRNLSGDDQRKLYTYAAEIINRINPNCQGLIL